MAPHTGEERDGSGEMGGEGVASGPPPGVLPAWSAVRSSSHAQFLCSRHSSWGTSYSRGSYLQRGAGTPLLSKGFKVES